MKKLLGTTSFLSLALVSAVANASPETCGFSKIEGDVIEFTANDRAPAHVSMKVQLPAYRYFTSDIAGENHLLKSEYIGRKAVFDFTNSSTRVNEKKSTNENEVTHVYAGYADNCTRVFAQVSEKDFPRYYNEGSALAAQEINFFEKENVLGILFHSSKRYDISDSSYVTGKAFVLSDTAMPVYFTDKYYENSETLRPFSMIDVKGIEYIPFTHLGQVVSDFRLKVEYDGKEGFVSGNRASLSKESPLDGVRVKYISAVKAHKVAFGMNQYELLTSLGLPKKAKKYPVYMTSTGRVVDYYGEEKGNEPIGYVYSLTYEGIDFPINLSFEGKVYRHEQEFGDVKYRNNLSFVYEM
jgi:hypothetical protein